MQESANCNFTKTTAIRGRAVNWSHKLMSSS